MWYTRKTHKLLLQDIDIQTYLMDTTFNNQQFDVYEIKNFLCVWAVHMYLSQYSVTFTVSISTRLSAS
jgi:hypothetical protein